MLITICDDIETEAKKTENIIKDFVDLSEVDTKVYSPEGMLLEMESNHFEGNIVILDIQFKDEKYTGIDLGKRINEEYPLCQIIYLTNFDYYHSDVYDTIHCYFVKKDMIEKTLPRALQKAIDIVNQKRNKEYIKLVDNGKIIYVKQREIDYIEKDGRLIFFNLENERYMSYMSIKALMNNLADNFGRCQSGFVINYDHIDTVKNDKIILQSGREIPIGRAYKKEFMRNYLKYMTDRI